MLCHLIQFWSSVIWLTLTFTPHSPPTSHHLNNVMFTPPCPCGSNNHKRNPFCFIIIFCVKNVEQKVGFTPLHPYPLSQMPSPLLPPLSLHILFLPPSQFKLSLIFRPFDIKTWGGGGKDLIHLCFLHLNANIKSKICF